MCLERNLVKDTYFALKTVRACPPQSFVSCGSKYMRTFFCVLYSDTQYLVLCSVVNGINMGMEHRWIGFCRVESKYLEGNPFYLFFYHKSYFDRPGIATKPRRWGNRQLTA